MEDTGNFFLDLVSDYAKNMTPLPMPIKIKYLPGAHELEQVSYGSWIDLYVYEDTYIKYNTQEYINLGVAMELPYGYEAIMVPRSSTYKNWGIIQTNHAAVIDSSYNGDNDIWRFPALALKQDVMIPKDTRICQFRIQEEQPRIIFHSVDSLGNKDRGGLGSTGE